MDTPSAASSGKDSTATAGSDSSDPPPPLIGPELEDKFTVVVDGEIIVLDDVTQQVSFGQKGNGQQPSTAEECSCGVVFVFGSLCAAILIVYSLRQSPHNNKMQIAFL